MKNVNHLHRSRMSGSEKFALWITNRIGTMGFFYTIAIWTIIWLSWNTLAPLDKRFDPFPAFVLWLFMSNMIQIFLMPLIMIGQNIQGKHSELIAENDFELGQKSEKEVRELKEEINKLHEKIDQLLAQRN